MTKARIIVIAVALLSYGAILWNGAGFSHPDDYYAAITRGWDFRPVLAFTYVLNRGGGLWMVWNLYVHVAAALLLLELGGGLLTPVASVAAACLFAAHPMAADAVASVSGRSSLLCAGLVLMALVALKDGRPGLSFMTSLLAFGTKEEAVILLVLLPLAAWKWQPRYFRWLAGLSVAMGLALALRMAPAVSRAAQTDMRQAARMVESPSTPRAFASVIGGYVLPRIFVPIGLAAAPDPKYGRLSEAAGWLSVPIVLPLAPYFAAPMPNFLEHRVYLTLAPAALLMGWLLGKRARCLVPVFVVLAMARANVYRSPTSLWEDAVEKSPGSAPAHINLAYYYEKAGRRYEAEGELKRAIEVAPDYDLGWRNLVALYINRNDFPEASRTMDAHDAHFNQN